MAILLTLIFCISIPFFSIDKKFLIYTLMSIVLSYMILMLFIFWIVPSKMLKKSSKGSYPKLAKIQMEIIDEIYKETTISDDQNSEMK
jgi:hypothetical protein